MPEPDWKLTQPPAVRPRVCPAAVRATSSTSTACPAAQVARIVGVLPVSSPGVT
jgi:hypothetical protein